MVKDFGQIEQFTLGPMVLLSCSVCFSSSLSLLTGWRDSSEEEANVEAGFWMTFCKWDFGIVKDPPSKVQVSEIPRQRAASSTS